MITDSDREEQLDSVDMQQVLETFVVGNESAELSYLRSKWIETVMLQMVSARSEAQLSQRELGARIGKPQSSIGRIERSSDIKLSTLFDHLSAAGVVPVGEIPCEPLRVQRQALGRRALRYREAIVAHSASPEIRRAWAATWREFLDYGIDLDNPSQPKRPVTEKEQVKAAAS